MESLGRALVIEELGGTLTILSNSLQIGRKRSFDRQIAKSIQLFLYGQWAALLLAVLVSERYGGSGSCA